MQGAILKAEPDTEFWTPERCFILEMSNTDGDKGVSVAQARVKPGITTQLHRLNGVEERYVVLAGEGRMEVGDLEPSEVTVGDVVLIPEGIQQRITNTGSEDLLFLCVCTPRFYPDCYEALGD